MKSRLTSLLIALISLSGLIGLSWLLWPLWWMLDGTHGLPASLGIPIAAAFGGLLTRQWYDARQAPDQETLLRLARQQEKAKVERDVAQDRVAVLQAKVDTLESALAKALSKKTES